MLTCQVCGYQHENLISAAHLRTHGMGTKEYREKFPGHKLKKVSDEHRARLSAQRNGVPNPANRGTRSEEVRKRISEAAMGRTPWNKGVPRTEEEKAKISMAKKGIPSKLKGIPTSDEAKKKLSESKKGVPNLKRRGKKVPEETRQKISKSVQEHFSEHGMSNEHCQKISAALQDYYESGGTPPMLGKNLSEETKQVLREKTQKFVDAQRVKSNEELREKAAENELLITEIKDHTYLTLKCEKCESGFSFTRQIFHPSKKDGKEVCPTCYPRETTKSAAEIELYNLIKQFAPDAVSGDRTVLGGKEIDIYIPSKRIGFEYTGLYWHRDHSALSYKHLRDKQDYAYNKGATVYTIFEDEFLLKREIVLSRIKSILGITDNKIYARKCKIVNVLPKDRNEFLKQNHLQGRDTASIALGLEYEGELVALATFKKTNMSKGGDGTEWELSRFCNKLNGTVVGGASKLIKHFMREYSEGMKLISYADSRWSRGNLYESLGFEFAGRTPPSFWFFAANSLKRIHRSALMKHRLVKCEEDKQLTGWELAQREGFNRIWDCGTTKWILAK